MIAMTELPKSWPIGIKTHEEVLAEAFATDPELAVEWERLALARAVAIQLIGYRSDHGLSQRELAERLGVSQPRVFELESGERNPQIETLMKISAVIGIELAIDIVPIGREPTLVGDAVKNTTAHVYAGVSVLVAGA
jgi:DNA-binding XRE family transcriptional regulator